MDEKYFEKLVNKCEELGWSVHEYDNGCVELQQFSPAGEDFTFEVKKERFVNDVWTYYNNFDIDDHIMMLVEAKIYGDDSIPSIRRLCEDAEDIDAMLCKLFYELDKVEG